jgi:hypothetical protein
MLNTWVTQRGTVSPSEWHIEDTRRGDPAGIVYTACGKAWDMSVDAPVERRGDVDSIRRALRCLTCQTIEAARADARRRRRA